MCPKQGSSSSLHSAPFPCFPSWVMKTPCFQMFWSKTSESSSVPLFFSYPISICSQFCSLNKCMQNLTTSLHLHRYRSGLGHHRVLCAFLQCPHKRSPWFHPHPLLSILNTAAEVNLWKVTLCDSAAKTLQFLVSLLPPEWKPKSIIRPFYTSVTSFSMTCCSICPTLMPGPPTPAGGGFCLCLECFCAPWIPPCFLHIPALIPSSQWFPPLPLSLTLYHPTNTCLPSS